MASSLRTLAVGAAAASALLLAGSGALSTVDAWGPMSHYRFACELIAPVPTETLVGSDLPDGMWNGWFLSGTQCPPKANAMHSPIFAGYLYQETIKNPKWNSDPYFEALATGYMTHVVSDEVGFAPQGGYLGNVSAIINWSLEWPFMLAVDSYFLKNNAVWSTNCPMPSAEPKQPLEAKGVAFLADVNAKYAAINPKFPLLTADEIAACTNPWAAQVNEMNAYAAALDNDTMAQQMIFFDQFGAKTFEEATANLLANVNCVDSTLQFFLNTIMTGEKTPEETWQLTANWIESQYMAGRCTVPTVHTRRPSPSASRAHGAVEDVAASSPYSIDFYAEDDGACAASPVGSASVTIDECAQVPALFNVKGWSSYRVTMTDAVTNQYKMVVWTTANCTGDPISRTNSWPIVGTGSSCNTDTLSQYNSFVFYSPIIAPLTMAFYPNIVPQCTCGNIRPWVNGLSPNACHTIIDSQSSQYLSLFADGTFSFTWYGDAHCQLPTLGFNVTGSLGECAAADECHWGPIMVSKTQPSRTPHRFLQDQTIF